MLSGVDPGIFCGGGITWKNWKKWLPRPLAVPKIDGFSYVLMHILKKLQKNLEKLEKILKKIVQWGGGPKSIPSQSPYHIQLKMSMTPHYAFMKVHLTIWKKRLCAFSRIVSWKHTMIKYCLLSVPFYVLSYFPPKCPTKFPSGPLQETANTWIHYSIEYLHRDLPSTTKLTIVS